MATESSLHANAIAAAIARVAKARRRTLGLSLDALVKASGVSKGMLVEIERGSGNPSIATLCKLAAGLGISVADLIAVEPEAIAHVVAEEDATILWRGPSGFSLVRRARICSNYGAGCSIPASVTTAKLTA